MTLSLQDLPFDIYEKLCQYISLKDVQKLMRTCKTLYENSHNNVVCNKILIKVKIYDYTDFSESSKLKQLLKSDMYFGTIHFEDLVITQLLKDFLLQFAPKIKNIIYESSNLDHFKFLPLLCYFHDIHSLNICLKDMEDSMDEEDENFAEDEYKRFMSEKKYEQICSKFENLADLIIEEPEFKVTRFMMDHFFSRVNSLKKLCLEISHLEDVNFYYDFLAKQVKTLEHLEIYDDYMVFEKTCNHFQKLGTVPGLKLVTFHFISNWNLQQDDEFEKFCQTQPLLEKLVINITPDYYEEQRPVKRILRKSDYSCLLQLKKLKSLYFEHRNPKQLKKLLRTNVPNILCLLITDPFDFKTFQLLSVNYRQLEELTLGINESIQPFHCYGIQLIFQNLINLKDLALYFHGEFAIQNESEIESKCKISNLKKLEILKIGTTNGKFPGLTINDVAELKNLKELYLEDFHIQNTSYEEYNKLVTSCTKLEKFEVVNVPLLDNNLMEILSKNCKNLSHIKIEHCSNSKLSPKINDRILANCPSIKTLEIKRHTLRSYYEDPCECGEEDSCENGEEEELSENEEDIN